VVGDAEFVVGMARPGTFQKGHPRLGGRKKGVPGKRNSRYAEYAKQQQREQEILEAKQAFQDALAGVTNFSPLQVMHAVMLLRISKGDAAGALEAAREAAPYVHAKLNAAEVRVQHSIAQRSDEEVALEIEMLRAKIARSKELPPPQIEDAPQTLEGQAQDVPVASE